LKPPTSFFNHDSLIPNQKGSMTMNQDEQKERLMLLGAAQFQVFESVLAEYRLKAIGLNYNSAPPLFKAWAKSEPYQAA
jgi:hypothetical protein